MAGVENGSVESTFIHFLIFVQAFPEMQAVDARFQPARAQIQEKLKKEGKL